MSDRLALANAIEDAGIERGKAEQLAATSPEEHRHGPHRPRSSPAAHGAAAAEARDAHAG
jgi:hypothetical protein